jgi:hypothetical protein
LYSVEFSVGHRARVWINESGPAAFKPSQLLQTRFLAGGSPRLPGCASVTIEVVQARGGRAVYGLLGAAFERANEETEVQVTVPVVDAAAGALGDAIAFSFDPATVGLRREFALGVFEGVGDVAAEMPALLLRFTEAAETAAGSSSAMFRSLARSVCRIGVGQSVPTGEELKELLRLTF